MEDPQTLHHVVVRLNDDRVQGMVTNFMHTISNGSGSAAPTVVAVRTWLLWHSSACACTVTRTNCSWCSSNPGTAAACVHVIVWHDS